MYMFSPVPLRRPLDVKVNCDEKPLQNVPEKEIWSLTGSGSVQVVVEESFITCNENTTTTAVTTNRSFAYPQLYL